ncbi:Splicing factor 3A subunit 2 [Linum perenne]
MDREWGSKPGSGGAASSQNEAIDRRERLRRLALETIDLAKDPYFMRNHLGSYECKLCLTLHNNEGNYLAHTQGKRHQTNLAKRAAREAKESPALPQPNKRKVNIRKSVKIGRPGYRVTKQFDPETKQRLSIPKSKTTRSQGTGSCPPMSRKFNPTIRATSIFYSQLILTRSLPSRFPVRRLISQLLSSSPIGILTPRCSLYSYTSRRSHRKPSQQHQTEQQLPASLLRHHRRKERERDLLHRQSEAAHCRHPRRLRWGTDLDPCRRGRLHQPHRRLPAEVECRLTSPAAVRRWAGLR